ncbi:MATE family efflux transporter [Limibacter armeniacum]|uniref:MATE family efflux transporter n=1 Tax=Limibacter armeniacum TaxID=466084 RepID=UPI002FE61448
MKRLLSHYKSTLSLGIPVILAQMGQISVGIVDNMMIGHVGTQELAAASFANTIFGLTLIFGMGFSFIFTPLIGEAFGQQQHQRIGLLLKNGLVSSLLVGLGMISLLLVTSLMMDRMGQPMEIVPASRSYLLILTSTVLPMMLFYTFKQFAEGIGDTRTSMVVMLVANVVNVIGNYIFINGYLGMPEMGLMGAGIGTVMARITMMVGAIGCFVYRNHMKVFVTPFKQAQVIVSELKEMAKMGIPLGAQTVMEASAFGLSTVMMGWTGAVGLAAHQVAISISTLGFMIYQGIGAATTIRISFLRGKLDFEGIKDASIASIHITMGLVLILASFFLITSNWLPTLYTDDHSVIMLASSFMLVLAAYQLPDAMQIILASMLRAMSDVKIPAVITFISYFIISLPAGYLMTFQLGVGEIGIWYGFPIGLTICSTLFIFRFLFVLKEKRKKTVAQYQL